LSTRENFYHDTNPAHRAGIMEFLFFLLIACLTIPADEAKSGQTDSAVISSVAASSTEDDTPRTEIDKRINTIYYGIETQVIELLTTLRSEKNDEYMNDLIDAYDRSTSPKLRGAILDFFADRKYGGAEEKASLMVRDRDANADSLVAAAFSYLLAIKSKSALEYAVTILEDEEKKYFQAAIKTLGAVGSDAEAEMLRKTYDSEQADVTIKESIILALGTMKSTSSFDMISSILSTDESTKTQRMYACSALGELGDVRAVSVLVNASQSSDPNVRAYAIAALGKYSEEQAMAAVREGLRDSHVLVRLEAAKAAGASMDKDAIPFLEFKASYDPEKSVREASINGLAAIGGTRVDDYLTGLFSDSKMALQYRSVALGAVVATGGFDARQKALEAFQAAQTLKDRALFTAYAKAVLAVDEPATEPFARLLLSDKDFSMRLGAIAWIDRNKAKTLVDAIRELSVGDTNDAVKKRAALALERLGL